MAAKHQHHIKADITCDQEPFKSNEQTSHASIYVDSVLSINIINSMHAPT